MKVKKLIPMQVAVDRAAGRNLSDSMHYIKRQALTGRVGVVDLPVLPVIGKPVRELFIDPLHYNELFPDAMWQPTADDLILPNCDLSAEGRELLKQGTDAARSKYPGVWDDLPLTLFTLLREARKDSTLWHLLELKTHA